MDKIRVLLAEDDPLAQHAINLYLSRSPDLRLVGTLSDGVTALEAAPKLRPDVAVVDIRMPNLDGLATTRRLTAANASCKVVCYTAFADDDALVDALDAGASGFLLKTDSPGLLIHAVRAAHRDELLISPQLLKAYLTRKQARSQAPEDLTDSEIRLLALVGEGLSNADIATRTDLTVSTIKTYVSRLLTRLDLPNRTTLAARAHEWGLVD